MFKFLSTLRGRFIAGYLALVAMFVVGPAASLATEGATSTKVKEIATTVGTEGVEIILAVLTALVTLIVAVIIIPKAIGFIRRFV